MLLELVRYEPISEENRLQIMLRWVPGESPAGTFGTQARFQYLTRNIVGTNPIIIEIVRNGIVVARLGEFPVTNGEWSSEISWVRVPPRGEFQIVAYCICNPNVNASLIGTVIAVPGLTGEWYVNDVPSGQSVQVYRNTPVFAKLKPSGSDQRLYWELVGSNESSVSYPPPARGYWQQNDEINIPISTAVLGTRHYRATLESQQVNLYLTIVQRPEDAQIEVRWRPGSSSIQPYGGLFEAQWRTIDANPNHTVELFVFHNNQETIIGTHAPSSGWQDFSWSAIPPRGTILIGARIRETGRQAQIDGIISPVPRLSVQMTVSEIILSRIPLEYFRFTVRADQSEYPIDVYENGVLIHTFNAPSTPGYWNWVPFEWQRRPSAPGIYRYQFVLRNEQLVSEHIGRARMEEDYTNGEWDPPRMEMRWLGTNRGRFCDVLEFQARLLNASMPGRVTHHDGRLIGEVPFDGNWYTFRITLGAPRGQFDILGIYNNQIAASLSYWSEAAPGLTVSSSMARSLRANQSYWIPFNIRVERTDYPVIVLVNGVERFRINPTRRGHFCEDNFLWENFVSANEAHDIRKYEFVLMDPDAPHGSIVINIDFYFYSVDENPSELLELARYEILGVEEPQEEEHDKLSYIFFKHKLVGTAIYFQIVGTNIGTPYLNRTGHIFILPDRRKNVGKRFMIIEIGGDGIA